MRQTQTLSATTSAVDWDISLADEYNVPRIDITFASAPTTAGLITITKEAAAGSEYDTVIRLVNPVGLTSLAIEGLHGMCYGDVVNVAYANADGVGITATASVELPILSAIHVDGMSLSEGIIRSKSSRYRRYYHVDLSSAAPGASGAEYISPTANYLGGQRLNAPTDMLETSWDVHGDWDSSTDVVMEASITNMAAGAAPTDILKFKFVLYYAQSGIPGVRTQTFYAENTVGALPQYTFLGFEKEIDRNATDNPMLPGDHVYATLNVEADSDIDDVIINHASVWYRTTHVGLEDGDV